MLINHARTHLQSELCSTCSLDCAFILCSLNCAFILCLLNCALILCSLNCALNLCSLNSALVHSYFVEYCIQFFHFKFCPIHHSSICQSVGHTLVEINKKPFSQKSRYIVEHMKHGRTTILVASYQHKYKFMHKRIKLTSVIQTVQLD